MSLLRLPLELRALAASYLKRHDIAQLLRVHSSFHNDILISELHKKEVETNGGSVLCRYAGAGDERGVQQILAAGATVDIKVAGETALLKALRRGHISIVKILLENGACPNLENSNGTSPVNIALQTRRGDNGMFELLLHHGANANGKGTSAHRTALFVAISSCDPTKVRLLLYHGADASMQSSRTGTNPLHTAAKANAPSEITRLLIEFGARIDDYDSDGKTPLQRAALYSSARVVDVLLKQGVNANLSSHHFGSTKEDGKTALFYATK